MNISFSPAVTPALPPNVTLELSGFVLRAAYVKFTGEPLDVKVKRAGETEWESAESA